MTMMSFPCIKYYVVAAKPIIGYTGNDNIVMIIINIMHTLQVPKRKLRLSLMMNIHTPHGMSPLRECWGPI
jgi:hypothetical protein